MILWYCCRHVAKVWCVLQGSDVRTPNQPRCAQSICRALHQCKSGTDTVAAVTTISIYRHTVYPDTLQRRGFYLTPSCNQNGHVLAPEYQLCYFFSCGIGACSLSAAVCNVISSNSEMALHPTIQVRGRDLGKL